MTNEVNRTPRAGDPSTAELEKREEGRRKREDGPTRRVPSSLFLLPSSLRCCSAFSRRRPIARHASSPRGPARTAGRRGGLETAGGRRAPGPFGPALPPAVLPRGRTGPRTAAPPAVAARPGGMNSLAGGTAADLRPSAGSP